ncbi:MAG: polyribonucleotide nucleotidyltransferase [Buchnera aphidicola (Chaetogeoica yunlongensis)]
MLNPIVHKFQYGQHTVTLETGLMARQATAAVMTTMDDTSVFVTVVGQKKLQLEKNFFPMTVNYQERTYAAGRIPGGFFRREGRPSENEILVARLIDRPIRPLFPERFFNEIQIIATVVSLNPLINPDIVAIIGSSAALSISGIPFLGPIGAARVGYINNKYVLNPNVNEIKTSTLDLIVSGTINSVLMVEAEANMLSEEQIIKAIHYGHEQQKTVIKNIIKFSNEVNTPAWEDYLCPINKDLENMISDISKIEIAKAYNIFDKTIRTNVLDQVKSNVVKAIISENLNIDESEILLIFSKIEKKIVREKILKYGLRIDGRKQDTIRSVDIRTGILPRAHGSALFTRGETQSLVSVTLGTSRDAQNLDELLGDRTDNFLFHYNFPPYAVGEIGIVGTPKRREIGHGKLAKRSVLAVMPSLDLFPYTIRIVSEITESNGSSSMASVCGASLALMDAGVPISTAVAGVAMGLVREGNKFIILSDILGDEDYLGDMDFKVSGGINGITALQMDIKIESITNEIIQLTLYQAKKARMHILNIMKQSLNFPKKDISIFAPRIHTIKINPEKIKDVIGKGGSVIRMLTEETGTTIEIEDDGTVKISAIMQDKAKYAIQRIKEITAEIEVGRIYDGKVTKIVDFGAFVSIGIGKEGLVHISQIAHKRVEKVSDYLHLHQEIFVKVLEIDRQGRLKLSIKGVKENF